MADAKQGKTPIEDFYNGSSQSRVVLAKPRLGGFGSSSFAASSSKGCTPLGSVLRPSQLKPGTNPFLKVNEAGEEKEGTGREKAPETPAEDRLKDTKEEPEAPKFVPLGSTNVTPRAANPVPAPAQPTTSTSSTGFVFGQNLSERVVIKESVNNGDAAPSEHSSTNGTTEMLFTNAAVSAKDMNQDEAGPSEAQGSGEGLAAAAAEYERSHARPPPPTTNYSLTGEEGEINVLQISCRLFAWETGSWRERGRGVLRLNDAGLGDAGDREGDRGDVEGDRGDKEDGEGDSQGVGAARLVARVAGSLRVVLNTKLWPGMVVERAGTKSLRITAADAENQVKLFLIMGAPADIVQLYRALTARIAVSKRTNCSQNATSQRAAERLEADADDDDFLDKHEDKPDAAEPKERPQEQKTDEEYVDNEAKPLKRKEPANDDTPQKRQCPEILE